MNRSETNKKFYFTYGSWEGYPYNHGWTLILAPTRRTAVALFKAYHPHPEGDDWILCADIYDQESFYKTKMPMKGNGGYFEVEVIEVYHEWVKDGQGI